MATTFPTTQDTAATLYDAVNNATSTLSGGHTAGGTTIDLVSASLFPATGGIIYVGNERTTFTGKTGNQLTGMAVLSNNYSSGTVVAMYVDAEHHNALRGALVAVEARVGVTGDTTAGTLTKRIADLEAGSASVEAQIVAAAGKVTPVDADSFGIVDSAGGNALKELTWANLKATLIGTAMNWTAAQTFRAASAVRSEAAATQDAMVLAGRAGGTSSYAVTLTPTTLTGNRTATYPDADLTVVGTATTQTMTNKRVTARIGSTTSSATPTINTDNVDIYKLTAQTVDITSFTTNLSGTPVDGDALIIEITGTAARAITWGASFEASTVALPTTTVTTAMLAVAFLWNTATSKWRCVAAV